MSDLQEQCHIDKGTYTDGPVLTKDVRVLFDRIAELEAQLAEARELITLLACYDDEGANVHLLRTGSYGAFDEPWTVRTAREFLEGRMSEDSVCKKCGHGDIPWWATECPRCFREPVLVAIERLREYLRLHDGDDPIAEDVRTLCDYAERVRWRSVKDDPPPDNGTLIHYSANCAHWMPLPEPPAPAYRSKVKQDE